MKHYLLLLLLLTSMLHAQDGLVPEVTDSDPPAPAAPLVPGGTSTAQPATPGAIEPAAVQTPATIFTAADDLLTTFRLLDPDQLDGVSDLIGAAGSVGFTVRELAESDAFIFIIAGQSNASGASNTGIVPATGSLPNVKFIRAGQAIFDEHLANNTNAWGTVNADDYSAGLAIAAKWQARINGGEALPDLYLANLSASSAGFGSGNPAQNDARYLWRTDGERPDGTLLDDTLPRRFVQSVGGALDDLIGSGKRVVIGGVLWIQGESDATNANAAADMTRQLSLLFNTIDGVTRIDTPVLWLKLGSNSASYPANGAVNEAMSSVFSSRSGLMIDVVDAPHYDVLDAGRAGPFAASNYNVYEDGVHYNESSINYIADTVIDHISAGNFGMDYFADAAELEEEELPVQVVGLTGTGDNIQYVNGTLSKITATDDFQSYLFNESVSGDFTIELEVSSAHSVFLSADSVQGVDYNNADFSILSIANAAIKGNTAKGWPGNAEITNSIVGDRVIAINRSDGVVTLRYREANSNVFIDGATLVDSSSSGDVYFSVTLFQSDASVDLAGVTIPSVADASLPIPIGTGAAAGPSLYYDGVNLRFKDEHGVISTITVDP